MIGVWQYKYRLPIPEAHAGLTRSVCLRRVTTNEDLGGNTAGLGLYSQAARVVTKSQILTHVDEEQPKFGKKMAIARVLTRSTNVDRTHTLLDFLKRPVVVKKANWGFLNAGFELAHVDLYTAIMAEPMWREKLQGFRYFRSNVRFTLVVNATPMHQGVLLMFFLPQNGGSKYWSANGVAGAELNSLISATGCLSAVLNVCDAQPVILDVPFTSPELYVDLFEKTTDMGRVVLKVYSGLNPVDVDYTLYMECIDPEVFGPTDVTLATLEVGESEKMQTQGVVASVTGAMGGVLDVLKEVPLISSIATPLSWVNSWLNKAAVAFGWSKPISVATPMIVKQQGVRYFANCNGMDTSHSLAMDADNQLEVHALSGEMCDEMALPCIMEKLCYFTNFPFAKADAADASLHTWRVNPKFARQNVAGTSSDTTTDPVTTQSWEKIYPTYMAMMALYFRYWHGGIKYQLRCAKTPFHSGRLRVSWVPGKKDATTVNFAKRYSKIWDLRTSHTLCVTVPFLVNRPWLSVDEDNGYMEISVINPLQASGGVATAVTILVEAAAMPDMVLAYPTVPNATPGFPTVNVYTPDSSLEVGATCVLEVGDDSGMTEEEQKMAPDVGVHDTLPCEKFCIGEKIVSVRQMLKRFTHMELFVPETKGTEPRFEELVNCASKLTGDRLTLMIDPFQFKPSPFQAWKSIDNIHPRTGDMVQHMAQMYAFFSGSIRLKFVVHRDGASARGTVEFTRVAIHDSDLSLDGIMSSITATQPALDNKRGVIYTANSDEPITEVQIPYYNQIPYVIGRIPYSDLKPPYVSFETSNVTSATRVEVFRAFADDASFSFLCGPPVMSHTTSITRNHTKTAIF